MVLVWRFDRFARSIEQLVLALAEFRTLGIDFVSAREALDTSTPMGKAMFTIVGAMAELERNVIRERILAGLEHARVRGTKSGAPIGRPRAIFNRGQVVELRAAAGGTLPLRSASAWPQLIRPIKPLVFGNLCHLQPPTMTQANELLLLDNAFENHLVF